MSKVIINKNDNLATLKVISTNNIYIDKNIKSVFENAYIKHPKTFNPDKYMYMYSKGDNDYFKNKDTRHYETVRRSL